MIAAALATLATIGAVVVVNGVVRFVRALVTYKRDIEEALRWGS